VRELCDLRPEAGRRASSITAIRVREQYADYAVYFATVAGENVEQGLAHFRARRTGAVAEVGTAPADVVRS